MVSFRHPWASKFVPWSDQQTLGYPRKQVNRQKAIKNASEILSLTSCRWIAHDVMQPKMITCASFRVLQLSLIYASPNMSTAAFDFAMKPAATLRLGTDLSQELVGGPFP